MEFNVVCTGSKHEPACLILNLLDTGVCVCVCVCACLLACAPVATNRAAREACRLCAVEDLGLTARRRSSAVLRKAAVCLRAGRELVGVEAATAVLVGCWTGGKGEGV